MTSMGDMNISMMSVLGTVAAGALGTVVAFGLLKWMHEWEWKFRLGKERWRKLPPGNLGLPFIGNMLDFLKAFKFHSNPDSFINSYNKRYNHGGVYKAFIFGSPTVVLTVPETCKQVMMNDEHFFPGWPKYMKDLVGKKSFLNVYNEEHKRLRKLTTSSIKGYEALSTYLPYIDDAVITDLEMWSTMDQLVLLDEIKRTTFRLIMHIFISTASASMVAQMERAYSDFSAGMRSMGINLPGFAYHKALKARRKMVEILQPILKGKRATSIEKSSAKGMDLIDSLIGAEDEHGKKLSDEEIIDIIVMYLFAGHETTAILATWVLILLEQHPEVQKKAKEEQEEIQKSIPSTQKGLTFKDYKKMEYLSKIIDEALRVAGLTYNFREAVKDTEINGYLIPKGWKIAMWYRSIHMDPKVYSQPEKFEPARWNEKPKAGSFVPFGGGGRLCPGNDLAKLEVSVLLHYFLLNYRFVRLNPESPISYLPNMVPADNCPAKIVKVSEALMK